MIYNNIQLIYSTKPFVSGHRLSGFDTMNEVGKSESQKDRKKLSILKEFFSIRIYPLFRYNHF
jgi:hypothetical protein